LVPGEVRLTLDVLYENLQRYRSKELGLVQAQEEEETRHPKKALVTYHGGDWCCNKEMLFNWITNNYDDGVKIPGRLTRRAYITLQRPP
jgi:hypothetical protein